MTTDVLDTNPGLVEVSVADSPTTPLADAPDFGPDEQDAPEPVAKEKPSIDDSIEKAFRKAEADAKKEEPKVEAKDAKAEQPKAPEKKPEQPRENGRFAPKAAAEGEPGAPEKSAAGRVEPDSRSSEGRKYSEPPARFLPEARTKWANVPNEVKAEFHRVMGEVEAERETSRQAVEAYESVKHFDEMARRSGTTMARAMENYVNMENLLRTNLEQGIATLLHNRGITPQQYAEHVLKNPHLHQPANMNFGPQQRQAQQPQAIPEVESLKSELMSLRAEMTVVPVIQEFARSHPDFDQVGPSMKEILDSGVLDRLYGNLPIEQKLAEAYRMAGGTPSHPVAQEQTQSPVAAPRKPSSNAGSLSITGSPSTNAVIRNPKKKSSSIDEAIQNALRRAS